MGAEGDAHPKEPAHSRDDLASDWQVRVESERAAVPVARSGVPLAPATGGTSAARQWQPAQEERLQPPQLAPEVTERCEPPIPNVDGRRSTFSAWQFGQVTRVEAPNTMVSNRVPQSWQRYS